MVDRQPSFLVLQLCLVLVSVIITVRNSKLAGAYGEHAKRKLQYQADSSGFINIDCGASESYRDRETGLVYELDTKYIDTGKTHEIDPDFFSATYHRQQRHNLRFFPEGKRNCYTLKPIQGGKNNYLIRAVFEYGNYDRKNQIPEFDLYLGVNKWTRMSDDIGMREIIHVPSDGYIDVCLVNTENGVPYISALELRPLDNSLYRIPNGALQNIYSYDLGGNNVIRYPEDVFDRYWGFNNDKDWKVMMSTESNIQSSDDGNNYKVPDQLLKTAATPKYASVPLSLGWNNSEDSASVCYIYFHFAELFDDELSREMMIELEGVRNISDPVVLEYLKTKTINSTRFPISGKDVSFKIYAAVESDLPPILNAVEVFLFIALPDSPTNFNDVDAIRKIKSVYGLKRDSWQGDPCLPSDYMWEGINCSNDGSSPPSIISLDLSSSGLKGDIAPYFANFTMIKYLDLSNNELTGRVPDLSQLTSLTVLNLSRNKLSGLVPAGLIERSNNRALNLSVEENPDICSLADSCDQKKKNNIVVPLVASIAAFSTALIAIFAIFCWHKKRKKQAVIVLGKSENKNDTFAAKKRQFTYSDIMKITKNFEKVLGKGGFGTVYHGYLDDTEVAVKLLSSSSAQGYKEFHSEVKLLMRVHHRNLTSLVGYCIEGTHMGIIYEYMTNGSLDQYISGKHEGKNASILSWEDRMRIAVDAAQGLEYLHDGCKPPIIHRDVKSSNILLNEKLQAKIADFGMSRIFPIESGSHVCTGAVGTPGYLDPEYYSSNWLNEKSDVYSFGVVLLEIITSQLVILTALENTHISKWVSSMLAGGDIKSIVDPKLSGDFEINSAWKAVELALSCTSQSSSERPTMIEVVMELKECLALAMTPNGEGHPGNKSKGPRRMLSVDVNADESYPSAR